VNKLWHNGSLVQGKLAISAHDRGLTLGDGLFETLAVKNGVALWQDQHLERFEKAAREMGISFPQKEIEAAINALIKDAKDPQVLRLTLTRGEGARGLAAQSSQTTLIGTLGAFDDSLRFQPMSVITSSVKRNMHSPTSRLKTLSYIDNIFAARQASARGVDEALMLNTSGRLACFSIGNVFLEIGGTLVTPALSEAILPGIMRQVIIALARQNDIEVKEKQVKPSDIDKADVMFMTNSLRLMRPVTKCDSKMFEARSKIFETLMQGVLAAEQMIIKSGDKP
jgi:branched-chain amino acid aminotransferase